MKELSTEEKAKRYDEAIEIAKEINNEQCAQPFNVMTRVFPELKESEDERIKKWLIGLIRSNEYGSISDVGYMPCPKHRVLAWIEKQDEKSANIVKSNFKIEKGEWYVGIKTLALEGKLLIIKNSIYYAKEDGAVIGENESLFIDKHDGNASEFLKLWTIQDAKDGDVLACENGWTCIFKALDSHTNTFSSYCFMDKDKWFCNTGSECHTLDKAFIKAYNGEIHPATKEQCDLLFQRMKEAGYEWDAEKKELKKIEQKPVELDENRSKELSLSLQIQAYLNTASDELYAKGKPLYSEKRIEDIHKCMLMWQKLHNAYFYQKTAWSEEDEELYNDLSDTYFYNDEDYPEDTYKHMLKKVLDWMNKRAKYLRPQKQEWSEEDKEMRMNVLKFLLTRCNVFEYEKMECWLNSLEDRVQPQPKKEWSEKDKTKINYLIALLQNCTMNNDDLRVMNEEIEDWIKSLHPSWKPSDEQMTQLKKYCPDNRPLTSLYEQLKKLREE